MFKEKLRDLRREMILETRMCLINKTIESIRITPAFKIYNEQKIGDDYVHIPLVVEEMDIYGTVTAMDTNGNPFELQLEELYLYDLAHLHEQVSKERYKILNYTENSEVTDV